MLGRDKHIFNTYKHTFNKANYIADPEKVAPSIFQGQLLYLNNKNLNFLK